MIFATASLDQEVLKMKQNDVKQLTNDFSDLIVAIIFFVILLISLVI